MTERTHNQQWLEEHAMFSCCIDGCRQEISYPADHLRIRQDGELICENCYDWDAKEDYPTWSDLKAFNPFSREPKP
jgi:hypothetical protein